MILNVLLLYQISRTILIPDQDKKLMYNVSSILSAHHKITTTLYVSLENNVSKNALVFEKKHQKRIAI